MVMLSHTLVLSIHAQRLDITLPACFWAFAQAEALASTLAVVLDLAVDDAVALGVVEAVVDGAALLSLAAVVHFTG